MSIPLTEDDRKAIERLCADSFVGQDLLGVPRPLPDGWYISDADADIPYDQRVIQLIDRLKGYLRTMAQELDEFEPGPDTERLCSEAVGICLALRDIGSHFPEATRPTIGGNNASRRHVD